ncbi:MAG: OmcA/MtrC family decaheme c-type cytochrome [Proteobacteria bacterium]|nr:OmcA/MtrC family decaheme c-type cytochrome [Pseudomonadota bacterium]
MSATAWADLSLKGEVTKVTIASPPVVEFKVMDANGNPVIGLEKNTTKASTALLTTYANVTFGMAKLVPGSNGSPSKWVNYLVTSTPTVAAPTVTPRTPTTDVTGTLVGNGDGTYKYTFYRDITKAKEIIDAATYTGNNLKADLGDLTYDPNAIHRLFITVSGNARGTSTNTADASNSGITAVAIKNPLNIIYDFIPSGKAVDPAANRIIVDVANCNECHAKINLAAGGHTSSRSDTRTCVVCHTDQVKYGSAEATKTATGYNAAVRQVKINNNMSAADFPLFIHRLHRGDELTLQGYNFGGVLFNEKVYPLYVGANGQKVCMKCHTKTATAPQGDNWNSVPSRLACVACHDGIDFATGKGTTITGATTGHDGGAKADDKLCATCHTPADIKTYHLAENVTAHNPTVKTGLKNFTYEIKSATATASAVTVVFKISASVDGGAAAPVTFVAPAATVANPLTGFTGAPGFLLAYAKAQDLAGGAIPVDYNNLGAVGQVNAQPISVSLASLLSTSSAATVGTLSGPDASGYYTANIVGPNVIFPAGATMRAVALQGYFTQVSPAAPRHAISVQKAVTGDAVRRTVVDPAKCSNCHEWFEGHGGNRVYETQVCVMCHVPGNSTSGRGLTDAQIAAYPFSAKDNAILTLWSFNKSIVNAALQFPTTSNNFKDMVHGIHAGADRTSPFRDSRNRSGTITLIDSSKAGFPGILSNCEASCHKPGTYSSAPTNTLASTYEANNGTLPMTPAAYVLSFKQPNATDVVTTPFAAACVSCHDAATTQTHITTNGGQIKVLRSALSFSGESCAVCHAAGKEFDPVKVHANLK